MKRDNYNIGEQTLKLTALKSYRSAYSLTDRQLLEIVIWAFEEAELFPDHTEESLINKFHKFFEQTDYGNKL